MTQDWDDKLKTTMAITAAGFGFMAAAGNIIYDYVINRNQSYMFGPFKKYKDSVKIGEFFRMDLSEETIAWAEKTTITQRQTHAYDGIALNAYCFEQPKETNRWLIAVHGYGQSASAMFPYAKPFFEAGYNVMIPECRGCGRSGGDFYGLGWVDRMDIVKWTRQISADDPQSEIVLFGLSTGADAVLMASGEDNLPSNVRCIISDSAYSRLTDLSNCILKRRGLPAGLLTFSTSLVTYLRAGYSFMQASAVNPVAKSSTPTLFIHGGQDEIFPVEMCYELYEAATVTRDIMIVQEASHGYAMFADYEHYWERVHKFMDAILPPVKSNDSYVSKIKNRFRRGQ